MATTIPNLNHADTLLNRYSQWVVNYPVIALLLTAIIIAASAFGMRNLQFKSDYREFFSSENKHLQAFDALEKMYTKNDNVMFIVTPKDGNVFTADTLTSIRTLTDKAWKIPYSSRVDSVTNYQHIEAEGDELVVRDLVADDTDLAPTSLEKIKNIAISEPMLQQRLISKTGNVTGVNVTVQIPPNGVQEVEEIVAASRELAEQIRQLDTNLEVRLSGLVFMNNAFSESTKKDMSSLVLLSFVLMLVTLGFILKSFSGTIATFFVIVFSIVIAMGLGGHMHFPITPPTATTPNIVLTVAIANAVHILITLFQQMRKGHSKKLSIVESLRINMQPVFLASATTAVGFLTMNFSDVPPFKHLGSMVAFGVLASFVLSVLFLPALLSLIPIRINANSVSTSNRYMAKIGDFVVRRRHSLMIGMLALIVGLISFLPRNELNDIFLNYFDKSVQFRVDSDYMVDNLSGLYIVDYSVDSGITGGISNPDYLSDLEKFSQWYRQQPETINVATYSDIMKRMNKSMHGDEQSWYKVPDNRSLAAQYLLMYEMSLPYGLDIKNQVNVDRSATRFTVTTKTLSTNDLLALEHRAEEWLATNAPALKHAQASGPSIMFGHIGKQNIVSMLTGTTVALVLISFILIIALRSFKIGFISLLPNLVPAAMGFGLWGLAVGEVGLSLAVVASMTLGIVVDDTVHFLSKYLRARREQNINAEDAVRYAFTNVGMALITTSVVLAVGFIVLAMSSFKLNSGMGTLTAIVIVFALAADFLFLPPLLMKFDKRTEKEKDNENEKDDDDDILVDPASA